MHDEGAGNTHDVQVSVTSEYGDVLVHGFVKFEVYNAHLQHDSEKAFNNQFSN